MENRTSRTTATFSSMKESTLVDWKIIGSHYGEYIKELPTRVINHLKLLDGDFGGFPVDRLQHSLQTATHAFKAGENEEYVVCALLHDIGDTLATYNHADIAAAILRPFVSEENHWMVENHPVFQGYYFFHHMGLDRNMREMFRGHQHFERTATFCEAYDNIAFNKNMESLPLEFFLPMVHRLFEKPKHSIYLKPA